MLRGDGEIRVKRHPIPNPNPSPNPIHKPNSILKGLQGRLAEEKKIRSQALEEGLSEMMSRTALGYPHRWRVNDEGLPIPLYPQRTPIARVHNDPDMDLFEYKVHPSPASDPAISMPLYNESWPTTMIRACPPLF